MDMNIANSNLHQGLLSLPDRTLAIGKNAKGPLSGITQRNLNSSQSKTTDKSARPKITLVPTRHAAEFLDKIPSMLEQIQPQPSNLFPAFASRVV